MVFTHRRSSQVSEAEATAYREKLFKDVENVDKKMEKQRSRQEQSLHDRLTLLKQKKLQEKVLTKANSVVSFSRYVKQDAL